MALKFRRGTTAQKSGSLAFGEPYVNTTLGTLQIGLDTGDITLSAVGTGSNLVIGGISGSSLDITGNAKIDGNLTLGGNITIGDATSDTVAVTANLSSSLIPSNDNAFDLGSSSKKYKDAYLAGNITVGGNVDGVDISVFNSNVNSTTASLNTSVSNINTFSGSTLTRLNALETDTNNLESTSASVNTSVTNLNSYTSSFAAASVTLTNKTISGASNTLSNIANASLSNSAITIAGTSTALGGTISAATIGNAIGAFSGSSQVSLSGFSTSNLSEGSNQYYTDARVKTKLDAEGVISGSSQVTISATTGYSTFSSSVDSRITTEKGRVDAILLSADADKDSFAEIVSLINSVDTTNDNAFATFYTASVNRLNNIEAASSSYETKGRGIVSGSSQISGLSNAQLTNSAITIAGQSTSLGGAVTAETIRAAIGTVVTGSGQIQLGSAAGNIALATQTTGDYVASLVAGTNITLSNNSGENATPTIGLTNNSITIAGAATALGGTISAATIGNAIGAFSGSSQVSLSGFSTSNLSEGSNLYYTDARVKTKLDAEAVVSGSVSAVKSFLSLGNVTNESKATMFTSPTFTGTPVAPTAAANTNSTQIATTAYVQQELTDLVGGAAAAFDTLIEISASLASGDATLTSLVDGKLSKSSNLSDLTDASAARTNLGLAIGTNVQAYNSTLAAVAGGTYSGDDSITTVGTVTAGSVTAILPTGTISGSAQVSGLSNAQLTNSSITIAGAATALGGAVTADTIRAAIGAVVTGSAQVSHDSTTGYDANKHIDHTAVSITAGTGLTGGGTIAATRTLAIDSTVATLTGIQTLTNKTISGASNTLSNIANASLTNSSVTVTAGTGMSGGGAVSLGGSVTLTNAGVTSNVAGTGVSVSGATGAVTISIGQSVATGASPTFAGLTINGSITATGDITAYYSSDKRFKDNIQIIPDALEKVKKLNGVTWEWNGEASDVTKAAPNTGLIAQEVQKVLPEVVKEREDGFLGLDYSKMMGLMVEAIKEQQNKIDNLTIELTELKKQKGL